MYSMEAAITGGLHTNLLLAQGACPGEYMAWDSGSNTLAAYTMQKEVIMET